VVTPGLLFRFQQVHLAFFRKDRGANPGFGNLVHFHIWKGSSSLSERPFPLAIPGPER
jgi:hypothetical protein